MLFSMLNLKLFNISNLIMTKSSLFRFLNGNLLTTNDGTTQPASGEEMASDWLGLDKIIGDAVNDKILVPIKEIAAKAWVSLIKGFYFVVYMYMFIMSALMDIVEKGFKLFGGLDLIGYTDEGNNKGITTIIDFFLKNDFVNKIYLRLSLISLVVMVMLAIIKIIKQDYIDKDGPRSKGPIFRKIAISFILYFLIPPLFTMLLTFSSSLTMMVYRAFGSNKTSVADLLIQNSFAWGGDTNAANMAKWGYNAYDVFYMKEPSYITTNPNNLFISRYYLNLAYKNKDIYEFIGNRNGFNNVTSISGKFGEIKGGTYNGGNTYGIIDPETNNASFYFHEKVAQKKENVSFYWYAYIVASIIILYNFFQMLLALVDRLYKLVILYIIAPAPISQMVMDDGHKLSKWKDKVIHEFLRVVISMISFFTYIIMIKMIQQLDFSVIISSSILPQYSGSTIANSSNGILSILSSFNGQAMVNNLFNVIMRIFLIVAGGMNLSTMDKIVGELVSGNEGKDGSMKNDGASSAIQKMKSVTVGAVTGTRDVSKYFSKSERIKRKDERSAKKEKIRDYNEKRDAKRFDFFNKKRHYNQLRNDVEQRDQLNGTINDLRKNHKTSIGELNSQRQGEISNIKAKNDPQIQALSNGKKNVENQILKNRENYNNEISKLGSTLNKKDGTVGFNSLQDREKKKEKIQKEYAERENNLKKERERFQREIEQKTKERNKEIKDLNNKFQQQRSQEEAKFKSVISNLDTKKQELEKSIKTAEERYQSEKNKAVFSKSYNRDQWLKKTVNSMVNENISKRQESSRNYSPTRKQAYDNRLSNARTRMAIDDDNREKFVKSRNKKHSGAI